jgi:hypothetical protein
MSGWLRRMTIIPRAVLVLLLLAGCGAPSDEAASAPADTAATAQPVPRAPNVLNPDSMQVGDSVAGMRIEAMDVQRAFDGEPVGTVRFAGEARVSGRAAPHFDSEVDALCFFADAASAGRLPRFPRDERRAWFCFANQAEARRMLDTPADSGVVSIIIDRFTYHFSYSDAVNEARLVRVEARPQGGGAYFML